MLPELSTCCYSESFIQLVHFVDASKLLLRRNGFFGFLCELLGTLTGLLPFFLLDELAKLLKAIGSFSLFEESFSHLVQVYVLDQMFFDFGDGTNDMNSFTRVKRLGSR